MNTVILGGTKGMGRALARLLAERGHRVFLLGRDLDDLARSAADLRVRAGHGGSNQDDPIGSCDRPCDLDRPETIGPALDAAWQRLGRVDAVVSTAGAFATQEELEEDPALCERVLRTNFVNTILFCEEARRRLLDQGGGTLCAFSSVAGDRPRKPVVLYGASKAGLSAYLDGLDHRFHAAGLRVINVRPGFVRTGMTAGLRPPPFAGEPEQVAQDVLAALQDPRPVVYTPRVWQLVMLGIRSLPRAVMRRIGF
jgi:NAD(P)-dependent dehydrogenase (short-subunit alcohol dehydrogenase family)